MQYGDQEKKNSFEEILNQFSWILEFKITVGLFSVRGETADM